MWPMNLGGGGRGVVITEEGPLLPLRLGKESGARNSFSRDGGLLMRMLRGRKWRWGAQPDSAKEGRETKETELLLPRALRQLLFFPQEKEVGYKRRGSHWGLIERIRIAYLRKPEAMTVGME